MNKKKNIGAIQVFAAGAIWGTIGLFITQLNRCGSDSMMTSLLRVLFAFIIMAIITAVKSGPAAFKVNGRTLLSCALLGIICHGIYNVFYSIAVVSTGVTISAVLLNIAPVFTALTSRIIFSEKLTPTKILAIAVNVIGCILAVTGGDISLAGLSVTGILFGIGAGFCYALTAIIGRIAGNKADAFVISTYSYLFAALFLMLFLKPMHTEISINYGMVIWGFSFALIPTSIAYIIYYKGVQKISESSKVPVYASVETIVAAILGVLILHERIGAVNILGIALVIISIVLMNSRKKVR